MELNSVRCEECGCNFSYMTKDTILECPGCGSAVSVEPSDPVEYETAVAEMREKAKKEAEENGVDV